MAVCGFCSRLHQCRDRNFSISLRQCNHLPHAAASNAASVTEQLNLFDKGTDIVPSRWLNSFWYRANNVNSKVQSVFSALILDQKRSLVSRSFVLQNQAHLLAAIFKSNSYRNIRSRSSLNWRLKRGPNGHGLFFHVSIHCGENDQ